MAALHRRPPASCSDSPESSQDAPASRSDGSTAFPATRALPRSGCPLTASDAGPTACRDAGYAAVQQAPERSERQPPFDSLQARPVLAGTRNQGRIACESQRRTGSDRPGDPHRKVRNKNEVGAAPGRLRRRSAARGNANPLKRQKPRDSRGASWRPQFKFMNLQDKIHS